MMSVTILQLAYLLIFFYGSIQQCRGSLYKLCDNDGAITAHNGTIVGNTGIDCTRVILAPKGYRINVVIHENTRMRDADLVIYDSRVIRPKHETYEFAKLKRNYHYEKDLPLTSISNAFVIHADKISVQTRLNMSFTIFRQPPQRCKCLPVMNGNATCTLLNHIILGEGDLLYRRCKLNCQQGYFTDNLYALAGQRQFEFTCACKRDEENDKWHKSHYHDIFIDKNQLTCSKVSRTLNGIRLIVYFDYENVFCPQLDSSVISDKVREHLVKHTSLPSVGECFKSVEVKNNTGCVAQSVNVTCSNINNGTAAQVNLKVHDNLIFPYDLSRYQRLWSHFVTNVTNSLKVFIPQSLASGNTSVTGLTTSPTFTCQNNAVISFAGKSIYLGCMNCSKHFHKVEKRLSDICERCPNGTRRTNNEETCVNGVQDYPQPSFAYCQHTCRLGMFFNPNSSLCEWCPYGSYQNSTTALNPVCESCQDGKTTGFVGARNSSECIHLCPAGKYLKFTTCVMCQVGFFMPNESNRFHKCNECRAGYTTLGLGATSCVEKCTTGQYFNMTTRSCVLCPNNTYQNEVIDTNLRSCKDCPVNTITAKIGSKSLPDCLENCSSGEYVDINAHKCSPCPLNTYYDNEPHFSFVCKSCGKFKITKNLRSTNSLDCIYPCEKGEYFNTTSEKCDKCEINTYQDKIGKITCNTCPGKTFNLRPGSHGCNSPCGYGKYLNKSEELCKECPKGYYQNKTNHTLNVCSPCSLDYYNNKTGMRDCTVCPGGKITVVTAVDNVLECIDTCQPGTYLNKSKKVCQECLKGYYQEKKQYKLEHCTKCPSSNLTTHGTGATSLEQCVGYCELSPCLNGAECVNRDSGFLCTCPDHLQGKRCESIIDGKNADVFTLSARFPNISWNEELLNSKSSEYVELARKVENNVRQELKHDPSFRTVIVTGFSAGSVISELELSYVAAVNLTTPVDSLSSAIADGRLGNLTTDKSYLKVVNFTCTQPLGMESGRIPDAAITSSRSLDDEPPANARLNSPSAGWAPRILSGEVYLQVDFGDVILLTAVATQGSSYDGGSWLTSYYLQYSSDEQNWMYYVVNSNVRDILLGNDDVNSTVQNVLEKHVRTRYIRMFSYGFKKWMSFRVEFYGCPIPKNLPLPGPSTPTPGSTPKVVFRDDDDEDSNIGLIVGVVLGAVALIFLVVICVWLVKRKHTSHRLENSPNFNYAMELGQKSQGR